MFARKIVKGLLGSILLLFCACRPDVDNIDSSKFYRDYDVFTRMGIDPISADNLDVPFIQEYSRNDSIIIIRVYSSNSGYQEVKIPAQDGIMVQAHYSIKDSYDWLYATISNGRIIRYGYEYNPYDSLLETRTEIPLHMIIPEEIEVITKDTTRTFFYPHESIDNNRTGDWQAMKSFRVLPFQVPLDMHGGFITNGISMQLEVFIDSTDHYIVETYNNLNGTDRGKSKLVARYAYERKFKIYRQDLNPLKAP